MWNIVVDVVFKLLKENMVSIFEKANSLIKQNLIKQKIGSSGILFLYF